MKLSEMIKSCYSSLTLGIPVIRPTSRGTTEEGLGEITNYIIQL